MNNFIQKIFLMNILLIYSIESFRLDKSEDVYLPLSKLHHPSDWNRNRINPLLTFLRSSFVDRSIPTTNDDDQRVYSHFHRRQSSFNDDQDEKTLIVRMHIEPKENFETKFVRLFIDTKNRRH